MGILEICFTSSIDKIWWGGGKLNIKGSWNKGVLV